MNIIEIIPLARGRMVPETLSYFSTKKLNLGDLVSISIRRKNVNGIVKNISELKNRRAELRRGNFSLKALKNILSKNFISPELLSSVEKISAATFIPENLILFKLIPKALISKQIAASLERASAPLKPAKYTFSGSLEERIIYFRTLIREHFARNQSVMLLSPRLEIIKEFERSIGRGIEEYVFSFSSESGKKSYREKWKKARELPHAVLVLGTPQTIFFSREDLKTVIIDEEGSRAWRELEYPWMDFRLAAEVISEKRGQDLILSGEVLGIETIWRNEQKLLDRKNSPLSRIQSKVETFLFETKPGREVEFHPFGPEFIQELKEGVKLKEDILVFINRRGYSSFTVCLDCSRPVLCENCSVPLVLHSRTGTERKFVCHHCLKNFPVPKRCPNCLSWNLKDYGIGMDKVESELRKNFPDTKIYRFDKMFLKDKISKGEASGKIVLSTESILAYPALKFQLTGVVSLDHLFTIPDFRMGERIFRLISELKSKTQRKFILQSRLSEHGVFNEALAGNVSSFYNAEIKRREKFAYPPFKTLIKLSRADTDASLLKQHAQKAELLLSDYAPISFPAFLEKTKKKYNWNVVVKISPDKWPGDEKLSGILNSLVPAWNVIVNPESII